jgi:hypothetical protein
MTAAGAAADTADIIALVAAEFTLSSNTIGSGSAENWGTLSDVARSCSAFFNAS